MHAFSDPLNALLVRYSNGQPLSGIQMMWNYNGSLISLCLVIYHSNIGHVGLEL